MFYMEFSQTIHNYTSKLQQMEEAKKENGSDKEKKILSIIVSFSLGMLSFTTCQVLKLNGNLSFADVLQKPPWTIF